MTKKEALRQFKELVEDSSIPADDVVWLREAWLNFTDMLCKDRQITMKQYENWSNPY